MNAIGIITGVNLLSYHGLGAIITLSSKTTLTRKFITSLFVNFHLVLVPIMEA